MLSRYPAVHRVVELIVPMFVLGFAIYEAYIGKLFSPTINPDYFRDVGILYNLSSHVIKTGHYQIGQYFFPPSNTILIHLFSQVGEDLAFRIFLILQSAALVVTVVAWSRLLKITDSTDRMLIVLFAVLASFYYVRFDLRMHNLNLLCLALTSIALWRAEKPWLAGPTYALGIALKPYGWALVFPWMLWNRRFQWCLAAAAWCVTLLALLPLIWFGTASTVTLYAEWARSLIHASTAGGPISLRGGIAAFVGIDPSSSIASILSTAAQLVWIFLLIAFFVPALRRRAADLNREAVCELAALLIVPLPLGDLQQPARSAVMLAPMLVIATAAFERSSPVWARCLLGCILLIGAVLPRLVGLRPFHWILTWLLCILLLLGLAVSRWIFSFQQTAVSPTPHSTST